LDQHFFNWIFNENVDEKFRVFSISKFLVGQLQNALTFLNKINRFGDGHDGTGFRGVTQLHPSFSCTFLPHPPVPVFLRQCPRALTSLKMQITSSSRYAVGSYNYRNTRKQILTLAGHTMTARNTRGANPKPTASMKKVAMKKVYR